MTIAAPKRKRSFSSFTYKDAFKQLGIDALRRWDIDADSMPLSDFFQKRLERLQRFDLESFEVSKTLLIDAVCEEGLEGIDQLKIWKGAYIESSDTYGNADYLIAQRRAYLESPFVCVIEAKKDDFEQGTAQCLVEMQACRYMNRDVGREIEVFGVVTNGEGWKFYRYTTENEVYETLLYGIADMPHLIGTVRAFFQLCSRVLEA